MKRKSQLRSGSMPVLLVVMVFAMAAAVGFGEAGALAADPPDYSGQSVSSVAGAVRGRTTADHSQFEELQHEFPDGPAVTAACLSCHTEAAKQIMKTSHWTWLYSTDGDNDRSDGQAGEVFGKAHNIINNFCIALPSNEPRCTSCHIGYGWKDGSFDFSNELLVDCLVCHDRTGSYKKFPTAAGHPVYEKDFPDGREWPKGSGKTMPPVDLTKVAQNVGPATRNNCGSCHFFGGGGEGVKHGDMDVTLANPHRSLDVHMDVDGPNFDCTMCHTTKEHDIAGRHFEVAAYNERQFVLRGVETNLLACETCHTNNPHPDHAKLNDHADKVSCQACHIPTMAREKATKMWWDWSKAGTRNEQGKAFAKKVDVKGEQVMSYHTKKGEFIWAKDAVPEYIWYNGTLKNQKYTDKVDDVTPASEKCDHPHGHFDYLDESKPVVYINRVHTDHNDPAARIWPAKTHRGIQPYDPVNKTLVVPKLFPGDGPDKQEAYWKSYDWGRSIQAGMDYAGLEYSGEYGWIQTEMIWPLKHMVAPKEDALSCRDCHARDGRLAALGGFYLPGRDYSALLDWLGIIMILGAVAGAVIHGLARAIFGRKG